MVAKQKCSECSFFFLLYNRAHMLPSENILKTGSEYVGEYHHIIVILWILIEHKKEHDVWR